MWVRYTILSAVCTRSWCIVSASDRDLCLLKILSNISCFGFCRKDVCVRFLFFCYFSCSHRKLWAWAWAALAHSSDHYAYNTFVCLHIVLRTCARKNINHTDPTVIHVAPIAPIHMCTHMCALYVRYWFYDSQNIWINHK